MCSLEEAPDAGMHERVSQALCMCGVYGVDHHLLSVRMRAVLRHLRMGVDHDPIDMIEDICKQLGVDVGETELQSAKSARCIMRKQGINVGCQAMPEDIFDVLPTILPMQDGVLSSPDDDSSIDTDYDQAEEEEENEKKEREEELELSCISSALTPRTCNTEHSGTSSGTDGRRRASPNKHQHQQQLHGSPKSRRSLFGSPLKLSSPRKPLSRANSNSSPTIHAASSPSMQPFSRLPPSPARSSTSSFFWESSARAASVACLECEAVAERLRKLEGSMTAVEAAVYPLTGVDRRRCGLEDSPRPDVKGRGSDISGFGRFECRFDAPPSGPPTPRVSGSSCGLSAAWPIPPKPMAADSSCRAEFGSVFGGGHMSTRLACRLETGLDPASPLGDAQSQIRSNRFVHGGRRRARLVEDDDPHA